MLKTLFSLWIFSWIVYSFSYFIFFDNAEDVVEKATLEDLMPYFMLQPIDTDRLDSIVTRAENHGFVIDEGILDTLEDNPNVINATVEKLDEMLYGLPVVRLQYELNTGTNVQINFVVVDKAYIRNPPFAFIYTPYNAKCNGQEISGDTELMRTLVLASFANEKNADGLKEAVRLACG